MYNDNFFSEGDLIRSLTDESRGNVLIIKEKSRWWDLDDQPQWMYYASAWLEDGDSDAEWLHEGEVERAPLWHIELTEKRHGI